MKKVILSLCGIAALIMASCTGNSEQEAKKNLLLGQWVMPVDSVNVSGFELKPNGVAASVNSVFQFTNWNFSNDTLYLTTVDGTTPWIVKTVSDDSLVISMDNVNFSTWKHK